MNELKWIMVKAGGKRFPGKTTAFDYILKFLKLKLKKELRILK